MPSFDGVLVERDGYALTLTRGREHVLLRLKDLRIAPGNTASLGCILSANLQADSLELTLEGGGSHQVSLGSLLHPSPGPELLVSGARVMTCTSQGPGLERLGLIDDGSVVIGGGRILWVGPSAGLPDAGLDVAGIPRVLARGRLLSPGLVDCHAHPVFAGDRASEFAMRAAGDDYQSIAARGGGILATVLPTRASTKGELRRLCNERVHRAFAAGTTTMEAKSGYDLTVDGELKLLEVALAVDATSPVDLSPTLLGAHVLPPERRESRATYVDEVANQMVPRAAAKGLASAVDVYCDDGAFSLEETERIFVAAKSAGLDLRGHFGQFADLGGPELASRMGALSADHLEQVSPDGIAAMAKAGVVAVMLPGACVQLKQEPPPVTELRAAGVDMAVASDLNPGSIRCETLPTPMWLATTRYGMTVEEAWLGVTRVAARAMGRSDIGSVQPGMRADLALWDCAHPAAIPYHVGRNLVCGMIKAGRPYYFAADDIEVE